MRYKKIILFFSAALPICVVLRTFELFYIVEPSTGFFSQEFGNFGNYILLIIFAFATLVTVFSFTSHRSPEHLPPTNIAMLVSSLFLSASLLYQIFTESLPAVVQGWQILLLRITGTAAAVFFVAFGLQRCFSFRLPAVCAVIPAVYFAMRVICYFTSIASLALISDNLLMLAAYCFILLFMLNLAKLFNHADTDRTFRSLLGFGLAAVIFSLTQSIPHIILNLSNGFTYLHTSMAANIHLLFTGIFIAAFLFSHFSHKNACE
ncbi:MAG: hypothetical protein IKD04_08085 [Clostridia bacterium]|nr:hypothetical protein [Clostridia bacterium]